MENHGKSLNCLKMIFRFKPLSSGISQLPMFEDTFLSTKFLAPVSASHTLTVPSNDVVRYLNGAIP